VEVDRIVEWSWNARGEVRARTCRGSSRGEGNADGCPDKSLDDASTASFGVASGFGTHEKGNQHGCEQDFIVVPECTCSEDEKGWMNHIRNTHILGRKEIYTRSKQLIVCPNLKEWVALSKGMHR
jgi:hypothetical protein